MRTAFEVGIVLAARDMYSNVLAKAERNLGILKKTSKETASGFEKALAGYKKVGAVGLGITAASVTAAKYFEDAVRAAGENAAAMDRVYIAMGEGANVSKEQIKSAFSEIKSTWGFADEEISSSMKEAGGRLGDYARAMDAVRTASALAAAKNIDLGTATNMVTTMVMQYGDRMGKGLTDQEKFTGAANQLSAVMAKLGGNWEGLNLYMGSTSIKAKSAGQSLETVLATAQILGRDAVKLRAGGSAMTSILDTMTKIRSKSPVMTSLMPKFKKSGDFIDFLSDVKALMGRMGFKSTQAQLSFLSEKFGDNADMVKYFIDNLEDLDKARSTMRGLGEQTSASSKVFQDAAKQMETWDGIQKRLNARMEEFKEMLGEGALPIVSEFEKQMGNVLKLLSDDKTAKSILGTGFVIAGLGAEAGKVVGPMLTMVGTLGLWRTQAQLAAAAQAQLNMQMGAAGGTQAARMAMANVNGLALARTLKQVGAVGMAAFIGWELGTLLRQIPGLDEAVQRLLATLTGTNIGEKFDEEMSKVEAALDKVKKGLILTDEEKKTLVLFHYAQASKTGMSKENFGKIMSKYGISGEDIDMAVEEHNKAVKGPGVMHFTPLSVFGTGAATGGKKLKKLPEHQTGGYVPTTGLALLHAGERVIPKSMAGSSAVISNYNNVTVNLQSTGVAQMDGRAIADVVIRQLNRRMKMDARRTT